MLNLINSEAGNSTELHCDEKHLIHVRAPLFHVQLIGKVSRFIELKEEHVVGWLCMCRNKCSYSGMVYLALTQVKKTSF